jgi:hypothetical protein
MLRTVSGAWPKANSQSANVQLNKSKSSLLSSRIQTMNLSECQSEQSGFAFSFLNVWLLTSALADGVLGNSGGVGCTDVCFGNQPRQASVYLGHLAANKS